MISPLQYHNKEWRERNEFQTLLVKLDIFSYKHFEHKVHMLILIALFYFLRIPIVDQSIPRRRRQTRHSPAPLPFHKSAH